MREPVAAAPLWCWQPRGLCCQSDTRVIHLAKVLISVWRLERGRNTWCGKKYVVRTQIGSVLYL